MSRTARRRRLPSTDESAHELELEEAIGLVGAELRITVDRMATTNKELRASNEDIVSMNEELQSTNEELEAAKEEQQSLNEELTIVNTQLQDKLEELELRTADLDNLLNGTEIATLFLDREMRIRWYTPTMVALLSVKPADLGRPLADFACRFDDDEFLSDAIAVQRTLAPRTREVRGPGKRWYLRRLLPYCIGGDRIDGVVATFVDITDRRQAEEECRAAMVYAESIVETVREPLLVLDPELRVRTANSAFYRTFEAEPQTTIGRPLHELAEREWDVSQLRRLLTQVLLEKSTFESFEVERDFRGIGRRAMLLNARRLDDTPLILLAIEDITLRRAAEQLTRDLGLRDPLTGLPSRSLFHDRLSQALALARRSGRPLAVVLLDLDHFKDINDTLGHSQGDALLVAAAARLQACVRQTDTVARLGGDEFIVVLGELTNPQQAAVLAKKMIAEIGHPFVIDGQEVHIGASCGIAMHLPSGPEADPELILKNVDLALYRAKDEGRGSFCFYAPELTAAVKERKLLEHDLRLGLELGEFDLHYQPQVAVADGRLIGVEALLRWRSARRGSVLPGQFVPRAEESGLIVPLGA
jgi:diguanylate cyclase (GGDEF)-like protein